MLRRTVVLLFVLSACRHARDPLDDMGGIDDAGARPAATSRGSASTTAGAARRPSKTKPEPVAESDDEVAESDLDPDSIESVRQRIAEVAARTRSRPGGPPVDIMRGRNPPAWTKRSLWHLSTPKVGYRLAAARARYSNSLKLAFTTAEATARELLAEAASQAPVTTEDDDGTTLRAVETTLSNVYSLDAYLDEASSQFYVLVAVKVPVEQAADTTIHPAAP